MDLLKILRAWKAFDPTSLRKPLAWLFLGGIFSACAFQPFGFDILALAPGLWLLLRYMEDAPLKRCFFLGWIFGLGHFLGGLYWISISLTVDFKKFFWLFPFALLAIPSILACLSGLTAMLARLTGRTGWPMTLAFALFWVLFEWARGHILTGFPWNLVGYSFASSLKLMQITSCIGIYGLSLLTMIMTVLTWHRIGVWVTAVLWAGLWMYGHYRIEPVSFVPDVYLRLVQPSVSQELKWEPSQRNAIMEKLKSLSLSPSSRQVTHILWPESAAVFDVVYDKTSLDSLATFLPQNTQLIFGAPHIQRNAQGRMEKIWNSLFVLDDLGALTLIYDKAHLVPFGEYLPGRQLLPDFVKKVTPGALDYSQGPGRVTVAMGSLPAFSPLICYEIIFPNQVVDLTKGHPQWLLNVTNDGWFGLSTGPYQHLAMAQTRAIETGLPLVRVANNGVSVITDGYGQILKKLGLNDIGVLDSPLPKALKTTPYARYGDIFFFIMVGILCVIIGYVSHVRPFRFKAPKKALIS